MAKILAQTEVSVQNLPEGTFKQYITPRIVNPRTTFLNAVLVQHYSSNRAYIGYPDLHCLKVAFQTEDMVYYCTYIRTPTQVAKIGNLLSYSEAVALFPQHEKEIDR